MEKKKSKTGLHIFIGILIGIIACIGIGYLSYTLDYISINDNSKKEEANKEETKEEKQEKVEETSFNFDNKNIVNSNGTYTLLKYSSVINISLDEDMTTATLNYNKSVLSNTYSLNLNITDNNTETYDETNITFNQKVVDVYLGQIGQDSTGDIILFLMEDGTISYIEIYETLKIAGIDGLSTYKTLEKPNDVIKFYTAYANVGMTGNYVTTLVQTKDGKIYDLAKILYNVTLNN